MAFRVSDDASPDLLFVFDRSDMGWNLAPFGIMLLLSHCLPVDSVLVSNAAFGMAVSEYVGGMVKEYRDVVPITYFNRRISRTSSA